MTYQTAEREHYEAGWQLEQFDKAARNGLENIPGKVD